ncbi:hypothetical protein SNEBB_010628 [Seison nebaliae]|nr:hypothetical protein SNEBB_010628 [Seison nebaliae]
MEMSLNKEENNGTDEDEEEHLKEIESQCNFAQLYLLRNEKLVEKLLFQIELLKCKWLIGKEKCNSLKDEKIMVKGRQLSFEESLWYSESKHWQLRENVLKKDEDKDEWERHLSTKIDGRDEMNINNLFGDTLLFLDELHHRYCDKNYNSERLWSYYKKLKELIGGNRDLYKLFSYDNQERNLSRIENRICNLYANAIDVQVNSLNLVMDTLLKVQKELDEMVLTRIDEESYERMMNDIMNDPDYNKEDMKELITFAKEEGIHSLLPYISDDDNSSNHQLKNNNNNNNNNVGEDELMETLKDHENFLERGNERTKVKGTNLKKSHLQSKSKMEVQFEQPKPDLEDMPVRPDEPRYCSCNQVVFGRMIACDDSRCSTEWYHLGCVGLTAVPKGKWVCPSCETRTNPKRNQRTKKNVKNINSSTTLIRRSRRSTSRTA